MKRLKTQTADFHLATLYAPVTGETLALEQVRDVIFSEKLVGVGIAIIPDVQDIINILAPADGIISSILPGNHAFFMQTDDGIEVLVHVGLNSVSLQGKGFSRMVNENQSVKKGQIILQVQSHVLAENNISLVTPVIITSPELYEVKVNTGGVQAGITALIHAHRI
ncbi:PTS glucose transporter subunit IIA [Citrobacter sp. JGM124]|uniref:PTS sugar transporter subunit IIA n=1 Tax=Citrobacter sp. JGM124 TaxID=2799789 RepID=UPI001BADA669|nr:PTS glucose transporter subunit IIA [Citrobacter sp. JGM124]MBS0847816.1 PTS glucose transporter subunit IIA [Citrobacter sp. JGM124]